MDKHLLLMYDRPGEPIFIPKGENNTIFDIPPEYMTERYQSMALSIFSRFGQNAEENVAVKKIALPDLSLPMTLSRHEIFSIYSPSHRRMAEYLIELFIGMRTIEDLLSLSIYCRDRINSMMFIYCLSVAILHRSDTNHLSLPNLYETFPDKFVDSKIILKVKEEANTIPSGSRIPVEIPIDWTATNADPEHRVAYWREDIGVNLHHWHWHLIYPFFGPRKIVNKDRRGELFYYYHHQMMARYNVERLCNNLWRTRPMTNLREPIKEAYFPKLNESVSGRAWPSRPANMKLSDVSNRSNINRSDVNISDIERYRDAIYEVIRTRQAKDEQGKIINLDDMNGIDILGNIVEASILSPNKALYGNMHNMGHLIISLVHDPDYRYLESPGVMNDNATAMRDPAFYIWHAFVDSVFYRFKDSLDPYTTQQLNFPGVSVESIFVNTPNLNPNTVSTHWTKSDLELSRGLDFSAKGSVLARLQHLNYEEFSYTITIQNSNDSELVGTLRIFIAPRLDEKGQNLPFNEQRKLMIEMDKFTAKLMQGQNVIVRKSTESSLTIPYEVTFRDVSNQNNQITTQQSNYCACGWPQHMLLPKGNTKGYPMDLFVMVTDYELDKVEQEETSKDCMKSGSFCGLKDRKFPDTCPMGFPFDRKGRDGVVMLNDFLTPNMQVEGITVRFNDVIKPRARST